MLNGILHKTNRPSIAHDIKTFTTKVINLNIDDTHVWWTSCEIPDCLKYQN